METRGGVLIWGLGKPDIIDVRFGESEADTYRKEPMDKLLACWEKENKYKHSKHCHEQWKQFSPFSLSVDGMLRK